MTDAVAVLSPTDRVFSNGVAVSGAKLKFFNAGSTTPKAVYSDSGLSSSLGSTVYTDSDGYPVTASGGSTKTAVYTGTAAFKVTITDSSDVEIISLDNVKGALDTSNFATGTLSNAMAVLSKTTTYTIATGDGYKVINANASGGAFTMTLPSAAPAGDGWWVMLRGNAAASSNEVTVARAGSDTIRTKASTSATSVTLSAGAAGFMVSDGAGWNWIPIEVEGGGDFPSTTIASASTTNLGASSSPFVTVSGTTTITSFGSAPNRFRIVYFSGALTLTHNATTLIMPGAANATTTAGDVFMFVSDSSGNWRCVSSPPRAVATQSTIETGTNTTDIVTAGRMHFHPGVVKAWAYVTVSGGTPSLVTSYNISGITDAGTGLLDLTFTTALSTANYAVCANSDSGTLLVRASSKSTTGCSLLCFNTTNGTSTDPTGYNVVVLGDI